MSKTKNSTQELQKYIKALEDRNYFNGSILVAYKGEVLLSKGIGMANFEHEVQNESKTKFRIGSLSKAFTSMAIMQLHERGLLNVHEKVENYLPDFPNSEKFTIHHLLTHTAGLFNHAATMEFWEVTMRTRSKSIQHTIDLFKDKNLISEPGTTFHYSNSGYVLLTAIIEKVSGKSYGVFVQQNIFDMVGMKNTTYYDGRKVLKNLASGYSVWEEPIHAEYEDITHAYGAYGHVSTVEDLYLWDQALKTEILAKRETIQQIFTSHNSDYGGYGWHVTEIEIGCKSRKFSGHLGDTGGFINYIGRFTEDDLTVIALSNVSLTPVENICLDISKMMFGEIIEIPAKIEIAALSEKEVELVCGEYLTEQNEKLTITSDNGKLYITMPKRYGVIFKYEIFPINVQPDQIEFVTDFLNEKLLVESKSLEHIDVNQSKTIAQKA
ncbi:MULTISPECIES: serine hydrolase [unclassified Bacillus (in: firmicutes)]|uniref:serine hydrolase domain-containing protein n=1 Tax=unclassified Bacillus (in: firmicutes) TaxID=185979 RepID=UPI0008F23B82|nr:MULTISPECIES: serine hydrolase domain-containing protein [unclassified Bacillus (in: firmicutes)]SFA87972.1 CubicO group peptidase, beta-lactamase class C family [Bacillus sp. UNCCL13]SFQ84473.1 CubicO group peptidase, beta-lactamase class C family [Bacillus sp. cl95]